MTLFSIFPRVQAPGQGELTDTLHTCRTMDRTYRYVHGDLAPHYPVPAKIVEVHVTPFGVDSPFHSTVLWCENGVIKAAVDFDFDRCIDFSYDYGSYVCEREIDEGIAKWRRRYEQHIL